MKELRTLFFTYQIFLIIFFLTIDIREPYAGNLPTKRVLQFKVFKKNKKSIFQGLPVELVEEIYSYLGSDQDDINPTQEIIRLSHANRRLREVAKNIASGKDFQVRLSGKHLSMNNFHAYFGKGGIFENVKNLNLYSRLFKPELLEILPSTLVSLNLRCSTVDESGFHVKNEGAKIIANRLHDLHSLSLGYNEIGDEGAHAIAENLKSLTYLNIRRNEIGESGIRAISENLSSLTELDIGQNKIGARGAIAMATGNLRHLRQLTVFDNHIGEEGAEAIAKAIAEGNLHSVTRILIKASNNIGQVADKMFMNLKLESYY